MSSDVRYCVMYPDSGVVTHLSDNGAPPHNPMMR
jgi:hypothetical protein